MRYGDLVVRIFKISRCNDGRGHPPDWTTVARTRQSRILCSRIQGAPCHCHSFSYVLKSPESTNRKQHKFKKKKNWKGKKKEKLKVKNYTIYSRRNSLFFTYDTLNMYNHMQRTCLHGRPQPVSFCQFDVCKSQKCRKNPHRVSLNPG